MHSFVAQWIFIHLFGKNLLFHNNATIFAVETTNNTNQMKNAFLLCIILFGILLSSIARPIDLQTAQSVAVKFMGVSDAQLVSTYRTDKSVAAFYVFNTTDGFVIVAADDSSAIRMKANLT